MAHRAIEKEQTVTASEQFLFDLCSRSFLSLWTYPAIHRDQRSGGVGDGKEVADCLVVFENDIVIFSDKRIAFQQGKPIDLAWRRWHRSAVLAGANQLWGAERWIKEYPQRLFLDRACTERLPLELPSPEKMRIHLVLVANGAAAACRAAHGGSGSLMVFPMLRDSGDMPFMVGDLNPEKRIIHVLDEATLPILMKHCDTVADVVGYLGKREKFVRGGRLLNAAGEEELLACYLKDTNEEGHHDFILDSPDTILSIPEGHYAEFIANPQYHAKRQADEVSYSWDQLIETFAKNILGGTLHGPATMSIAGHENGLRLLAREPRVRRRMLASAQLGMMFDPNGLPGRRARIIAPSHSGDPHFIFLALERPEKVTEDDYRRIRQEMALAYGRVLRSKDEKAGLVVVIATNFPDEKDMSEDLLVYDGNQFDESERAEAVRVQAEWNILQTMNAFRRVEKEYPEMRRTGVSLRKANEQGRNERCNCGSGKKFKKCCGA